MKGRNWLGIGVMICLLAIAQMATGASPSGPASQETAVVHPGEISLQQGSPTPSSPPATHLSTERGPGVAPPKTLATFFLIGIVINVVMVMAVGFWAYKRLRKPHKPINQ